MAKLGLNGLDVQALGNEKASDGVPKLMDRQALIALSSREGSPTIGFGDDVLRIFAPSAVDAEVAEELVKTVGVNPLPVFSVNDRHEAVQSQRLHGMLQAKAVDMLQVEALAVFPDSKNSCQGIVHADTSARRTHFRITKDFVLGVLVIKRDGIAGEINITPAKPQHLSATAARSEDDEDPDVFCVPLCLNFAQDGLSEPSGLREGEAISFVLLRWFWKIDHIGGIAGDFPISVCLLKHLS